MPAVWSGSRLLITNPQTGTLTTYQATNGSVLTRSGLDTGGSLQVWGAES
ncbi:hypothetical protein ACWT_6127 [Actinoplanes sp. SE50]|nr:hypothetical protein ACPL_6259 [Actinoplanes sp. SE50/110]ATO85542.1 hypothetical protein ACWT_6127 [Actinoplanes sp. SE50]SLM02955.1 hypothetical protein ACSP50_6240 [Actinoplanes sp. SE50/110]